MRLLRFQGALFVAVVTVFAVFGVLGVFTVLGVLPTVLLAVHAATSFTADSLARRAEKYALTPFF